MATYITDVEDETRCLTLGTDTCGVKYLKLNINILKHTKHRASLTSYTEVLNLILYLVQLASLFMYEYVLFHSTTRSN